MTCKERARTYSASNSCHNINILPRCLSGAASAANIGAIEAFDPIYADESVLDSGTLKWAGTKRGINIPPHQEVLYRPVVSSMSCNVLSLCSISGSVAINQFLGANTTYYNSNTENSRKEERWTSSEPFLEWIAHPCSSELVVRVGSRGIWCDYSQLGWS